MEDWTEASVWRMGRTAEDRLMNGRSIKAAEVTSGNGLSKREGRESRKGRIINVDFMITPPRMQLSVTITLFLSMLDQ